MSILLILIAMLLVPVTALAQAPSKAGVVTTLEGNVTARRVALPDPVPLKFKDDVFLQDTVTTGDKALARMLLGGKAVVTVRERSVLTITEVPGRSTIELANGKFSLAVARERMRPGEEIQIRTPNAIAGVRGTVVIAEVRRQGAQLSGGPAVVTTLYVLRGTITAQRLDSSTGLPTGAPLSIGTMQAYSVAGAAPPRVAPIPPEQVAQIISGLQPTGPKGGAEAGQEQVKSQAVQTALSLLGALTGNPTDSTLGQAIVAGTATANLIDTTTSTTTPATTPPIIPPISEALASDAIQALIDEINLVVEITGSLSVPAGSSLKKFKGTTVSRATVPLLTLSNVNISQDGSDDLILAGADASLTLAGPLAKVIKSTLKTGGSFFGTDAATVVSSTTEPFIHFDPVTVTTGDSLIALLGGTFNLAGALFRDEGGTLTVGGNLLQVANAALTGIGADALIQLAGTTVNGTATPARSVLFFDGGGLPIQLAGALLTATGSTFTGGANFLFIGDGAVSSSSGDPFLHLTSSTVNGTANFVHVNGLTNGTAPTSLSLASPLLVSENSAIVEGSNLVRIAEGAGVSSTTTSPLVSISGGSFTGGGPLGTASGGSLLRMFSQVGRPGSTLTLAGAFAAIANATITTTDSDTFNIGDGSTVTSTTGNPFASFSASTVTSAFNFFDLETNSAFGTPPTVGNGGPSTIALAGSLVDATNTTFNIQNGSFFRMRNGVALTESGGSPLFRLTGVTARPTISFAQLSSGVPASPQLSLGGQFLVATNSVLATGDPTTNTNSFFVIVDGSAVTSASALPFLSFDGSSVDTAGNIVTVRRSRANAPSRLTLAGPLLAATNSTFNTTSLGFGTVFGTAPSACCPAFFIAQGAELTGTGTSALIQLTNSTITSADAQSGASFFHLTDTFGGVPASELVAPARATLAGPLLQMTNSSVTSLFDILLVVRSVFASTTTAPLITVNGGSLRWGAAANPFTGTVPFADLVGVSASGGLASSVSFGGPLLRANGATLSGGSIVNVVNLGGGASFTSTTAEPLVQLTGSTLSTSSTQFINNGFSVFSALQCPAQGCQGLNIDGTIATMTLNGPLLSASGGSSVNTTGSLVFVNNGGFITVNGSTDPLISLTGGTHAIDSTGVPNFPSSIFALFGRAASTANEIADGVALTLGTDEPIRHGGGFLDTTAATISSQQAFQVDTALIQASAPLLHLKAGSSLTTQLDAIDLISRVKLTSIGPVVKLDGSILTVNSGALASVRNGSLLRVTGDFLHLSNASTLNLLNGAVLNVTGNSVVNISGALVNFGGTGGNAINVNNSLCATSCTSIGGLNVNLVGGATAANVSITSPIKNGALGAINLGGPDTAVINVSGASSKVTISGN